MKRDREVAALVLLASLLPACTTPHPRPIGEGPAGISSVPYYLTSQVVASFRLDPPSAEGTPAYRADMDRLKAAIAARTPADCSRAAAEADGSRVVPSYPESFGAIGPFALPPQPEVRAFIIRLWSDASLVSEDFKARFGRPRPYQSDVSIEPCLKRSSTVGAYPSGHTLVARVFALALSDIDPARRAAYLKRADEIAWDRVLAGMHRPSEIEAGKSLADQIHRALLESPAFRQDVERMKTYAHPAAPSRP